MRYYKGHIVLSDERDVPVLLHIRNARAITFDQLCELLSLDGIERLRRSVHWRLSRLVENGLVQRAEYNLFFAQPVLTITPLGLAFLESRGHFLLALPSTAERVIHPAQVFHALELVNIRLALARAGILQAWKTELEITSRNLVLEVPVAKDYDALVEISVGAETWAFAIEYERTIKAATRYQQIREVLNQDKTVDVILYLTPNHDMLYLLAVEMRNVAKKIGFALSDSFRRDLLDARTILNRGSSEVVPFRQLLEA
jgi:hypothetical protein